MTADPFSLEAVREAPQLDVDIEKVLTTVPVRKPGKNEFFRVRDNPEFVVDCYLLEHESGMDRVTYWVPPDLQPVIQDQLKRVRLFTCMDKRGNTFLWPAKLPREDGSMVGRSWQISGLQAAEMAKKVWIRIQANKNISAYDVVKAKGDLGDPQWSDHDFQALIKIAFRDALINDIDHPVIREINGEL